MVRRLELIQKPENTLKGFRKLQPATNNSQPTKSPALRAGLLYFILYSYTSSLYYPSYFLTSFFGFFFSFRLESLPFAIIFTPKRLLFLIHELYHFLLNTIYNILNTHSSYFSRSKTSSIRIWLTNSGT